MSDTQTVFRRPYFLGTYQPKLDEKGRLILPAKYRARFAEGVILTRGQERCIFMLPVDEFERITDQFVDAPHTERSVRDHQRVFLSGAVDEQLDKQGRISIPQLLRTYAGLDREVAVVGAGRRIEIWDLAAWETYLATQEEQYAEDNAGVSTQDN